jgi:O-antigen/teichoic acid export membrane protein
VIAADVLMRISRRALAHNRALEAVLVGAQAAGVLAAVVVARSVGPAGRGTVVTITVWGQILGWLAALSMDKALVVLTSGKDRVATPDEGLRAVQLPMLGTSFLAAIASVILGLHFFTDVALIASMAVFAVATVQWELIGGWLLASGPRPVFIGWRLTQPSLYAAFIIGVALVFRTATSEERTVAMGVAATASICVPVILALIIRSRHSAVSGRGLGPLIRFALAAQAANILQYLNGRLDLLVLAFLVSPQQLGYYSVGAAFGQIALLMSNAGVIRGMTGEATSTDLVGFGIALVLAALVVVAAPVVVPLVFGSSFKAAVPIARILAIGGAVNFALQAACGRLLGRKRPWLVVLSQGIGVAIFLVGIVMLRSTQGVAWSSVASFVAALAVAQASLRLTSSSMDAST